MYLQLKKGGIDVKCSAGEGETGRRVGVRQAARFRERRQKTGRHTVSVCLAWCRQTGQFSQSLPPIAASESLGTPMLA
jgi:hypothetical protein